MKAIFSFIGTKKAVGIFLMNRILFPNLRKEYALWFGQRSPGIQNLRFVLSLADLASTQIHTFRFYKNI